MDKFSKENKKLINKLLNIIDEQIIESDTDDLPQIHELRKRVFFIHTMADKQLDLLSLDWVFRSIYPSSSDSTKLTERDFSSWSNVMVGILDAMSDLNFYKKINFAKKLGSIDQECFLMLKKFNELRNDLAHPNPDKISQNEYKTEEGYLKVLQLTVNVTKFCSEYGFKWFEELEAKYVEKSNPSFEDDVRSETP